MHSLGARAFCLDVNQRQASYHIIPTGIILTRTVAEGRRQQHYITSMTGRLGLGSVLLTLCGHLEAPSG